MKQIKEIIQKRLHKEKNTTSNKKFLVILLIIIFIIMIIILYFFFKNTNKNSNLGNNLNNKTLSEIEEYILNISSYEAEIEVQVESNKNETKYILNQDYVSPNIEKQVVKEPTNIQGLETIYDGNKLTINNSKLNLTTIYENYEYAVNNCLNLESFIYDYKQNNGSIYYENNEIVLEAKSNSENKLMYNKKLYINEQTGNPTKLLIEDINEKKIVYILYNEIKLNDLN